MTDTIDKVIADMQQQVMNEFVDEVKSKSPRLHDAIMQNDNVKTLIESAIDMSVAMTMKHCIVGK